MSDYMRVTFREPMQTLAGQRFVDASDQVIVRKAIDPRRLGEGVEIVRGDKVEFFALDLISSIVFAPVKGGVPVKDGAR